MLSVPMDVWVKYLPRKLDPKDLSNLSCVCKRFHEKFYHFISPNYRESTYSAFQESCYDGYIDLAEFLVLKCANEIGPDDMVSVKLGFSSALAVACINEDLDMARWLIVNHIDPYFALEYDQKLYDWLPPDLRYYYDNIDSSSSTDDSSSSNDRRFG